MPLLHLTDQTVFDPADGAGVLLDGAEGTYFELNAVATLMLQAALSHETEAEAVRFLAERIDAGPEVLREGLADLTERLTATHLAEPAPHPAPGP